MTKSSSGQTMSVWSATANLPQVPALETDLDTHVCVVGAGIAGLSTAYQLAKKGLQVVVLDDDPPGAGETGRTTAHLTNMIEGGYAEIEQLHGSQGARLAAESHSAAINAIEHIIAEEDISCDFQRVDGFIFLQPGDDVSTLKEEMEAAQRAGLMDVSMLSDLSIGGTSLGPALRFPQQGQFHVLKYLHGLVAAIKRMAGEVYSGAHVSRVHGGNPVELITSSGRRITARAAVLATNAPIIDVLGFSSRQTPFRTYAIGMDIPAGSVDAALYYDTSDPYHYVRLQAGSTPGEEILIVGGEDHKTGQADDMAERYNRLEAWARRHFPMAQKRLLTWSGQVQESVDNLAYIGPDLVETNVYLATGDTGIGMTHGTIAGLLLSDMISGLPNSWATLYNPARVRSQALTDIISENLNVVSQLRDWISGGEVSSEEQIAAGSGAIIGWGLGKVAVYRDEQGVVHRYSAVCPHLGCIVKWNDGEKTWDCPCHGSRFDAHGRVVNGPSAENLGAADG